MAFFRKGKNANYTLLDGFSWHVPGIGGLFAMIGWFCVGFILAQIISTVIVGLFMVSTDSTPIDAAGNSGLLQLIQLVSYPFLFLPAMIASRFISNRNMYFEDGFRADSPVGDKMKPWKAALLCCMATFALAYIMDYINGWLPEMSETWKAAMEAMVGGNFLINFLCVSIFAPLFEEWFIRGTLLRGLLNCKRDNGSRGFSPMWSIILTSAIFGLIHGNIWQALPAFALGCLFGYVYYKTGSLKLTMLMHCFNNTVSLLTSQLADNKEIESFADLLPAPQFYALGAACIAILILVILELSRIKTPPRGSCEMIASHPAEPQP